MGTSIGKVRGKSLFIAFVPLVLLVFLAAVVAGCGSSSSPTTMTTIAPNSTVVTQSSGADAQGPGAKVVLHNGTVSPTELQVAVGGAVTFQDMDDDTPRTYQLVSSDGSLDTGVLGEGDSYSITFQKPGTIAYQDKNDPNIKGSIVVQ